MIHLIEIDYYWIFSKVWHYLIKDLHNDFFQARILMCLRYSLLFDANTSDVVINIKIKLIISSLISYLSYRVTV